VLSENSCILADPNVAHLTQVKPCSMYVFAYRQSRIVLIRSVALDEANAPLFVSQRIRGLG